MRRPAWPWGLAGGVSLVIGIVLEAALANTNNTCASVLPGQTSPSDCSGADAGAAIGLVLIVVGVILLIAALVVALRRPT